jgi:short chain dehydrogenase
MTKPGAVAGGGEGAAAGDPRVALVTGANKGIGLHIARQLAQRGLLVLVGSREAERGRAAVAELVGEGLDVRLLDLDVTETASVAAAAKQVGADPGRLEVLVNNVGIISELAPTSQRQGGPAVPLRDQCLRCGGGDARPAAAASPLPGAADRQRLQRVGVDRGPHRPEGLDYGPKQNYEKISQHLLWQTRTGSGSSNNRVRSQGVCDRTPPGGS